MGRVSFEGEKLWPRACGVPGQPPGGLQRSAVGVDWGMLVAGVGFGTPTHPRTDFRTSSSGSCDAPIAPDMITRCSWSMACSPNWLTERWVQATHMLDGSLGRPLVTQKPRTEKRAASPASMLDARSSVVGLQGTESTCPAGGLVACGQGQYVTSRRAHGSIQHAKSNWYR